MLAIVVPAHNEEEYLDACLASLNAAAREPALAREPVLIVVVLDDCDDASSAIARRWKTETIVTSTRPAFKAPGGFGATLTRIQEFGQWVLAPEVVAA